MNYAEAIEWLYSTQNFGIKLGLDAPKELLAQYLAYPDADTKVAHIAGTNGKGSTCAILDSLARSVGIKTGLFTSPHLVDFRERICINGEMISEEDAAFHISNIKELVADWEHHPTFFELTLAIAMRYFCDNHCELIILETGMGGRLDATTAVPADVYGITPIGLDHTQWLGNTLKQVAEEKAGIIISSAPVVSAKQTSEVAQVIAARANRYRCKLVIVDQPLEGYSIALAGDHQKENAALALEIASQLELPLRYDNVKQGLKEVTWRGRFERISLNPLTVIDGAHNPHAAKTLVKTWHSEYPDLQPVIIFGAVESKDLEGVYKTISTLTDTIIFTPIHSPRSIHFSDIEPYNSAQTTLIEKNNLSESLTFAKQFNRPILITGSLYLLGEYYALLRQQPHQPTLQ